MTVALSALPQFFDNAGNPLSGGKVFTYAAGTLNPLATYTDRGGGTPNANPVILDAAGRADIWLSTNIAYKLRVEDSGGTVMDSVDQFYAGADPTQLVAAGIVPATGGDYTGLVNFNGGALFNGSAAQDLATLDSLGISAQANLWINSDCGINQRGATVIGDGVYGFDRIVNLCEVGPTSLGLLPAPEDGTSFAMRMLQPNVGAQRLGCVQIVEARNCLAYRGRNLTFSARVRCSAAVTVRAALVAWTGTSDAPTRDVVNNWASTTYTAGNFFVASTTTIAVTGTTVSAGAWADINVSSASAGGLAMPSNTNNLYMVIWTDSGLAQNATLDVSRLRCGEGTLPQRWTQPDTAQELARCQRYYLKTFNQNQAPIQNVGNSQGALTASYTTNGGFRTTWVFPVEMRGAPTLTSYNPYAANAAWRDIVGGSDWGAGPSVGTGTRQTDISAGVSAAAPGVYVIHLTASAEL